jgi:hypothetical protein
LGPGIYQEQYPAFAECTRGIEIRLGAYGSFMGFKV